MKYKIIVDKQSRTNPSTEKKEYEIDIEELHCRGKIYDSLVITKDEDYVMRRLQKNEYNALNVLEEPIKEVIPGLNIELFEGDNYIYLIDMIGNKIYAEYLVKNDFTDMYVTVNEMNSAINQTAGQIELTVNQKLTEYATEEQLQGAVTELNSTITQTAEGINLEVSKKANEEEICSLISQSPEEILLKGNRVVIQADKFTLDKDGKITATGGVIGGFTLGKEEFSANVNGIYNYNKYDARNTIAMYLGDINLSSVFSNLYDANGDGEVDLLDAQRMIMIALGQLTSSKTVSGTFEINSKDPKNCIVIKNSLGEIVASIGLGGINTSLLCAENILCSNKDNDGETYVAINGTDGSIKAKSNISDLIDAKQALLNGIQIITKDGKTHYFGTPSEYSQNYTAVRGSDVRLYAHSGGGVYLGFSGSTAITSDENLKNISDIDEKYIEFFKNLKPVTYVYKGRGHRSHIGFGARQVEQALGQAGLTTEQFAGVLKDTDVTISADEAGTEEDIHYNELYSLRYEEFIALNTMMIQNLTKEIEELKSKVAELEAKQ